MNTEIFYIATAAQWVMSVNYEFYVENRNSKIADVRRIALAAKTRSVVVHDRILAEMAKNT